MFSYICPWLSVMFRYKVVLDSDAEQYNGHKRLDPSVLYNTVSEPWDNRRNNMHVCMHSDAASFVEYCCYCYVVNE